MGPLEYLIKQYPLESGALEIQYIEEYFGEFPRKKTAREAGMAVLAEQAIPRNFSESFRREQPEKVAAAMAPFLATDVEGYCGCCDAIGALDYTASLARIRARTLIIAGSLDPGTPVAMSEILARGIPGAQLAVIDGAAHLSAYEKPEEYAGLVSRFLAR